MSPPRANSAGTLRCRALPTSTNRFAFATPPPSAGVSPPKAAPPYFKFSDRSLQVDRRNSRAAGRGMKGSLDCQPPFVEAMEVSITHEERAECVRVVYRQVTPGHL